jgi:PAS domain-containing protein
MDLERLGRFAKPRSYSLELTASSTPAAAVLSRLQDMITDEPAFVVSSAGRVVAWNLALEELTGIAEREVLGLSCRAALAAISPGEPVVPCLRTCPLAATDPVARPTRRVPFIVETPTGPRRCELVTICGPEGEVLHLVEEAGRAEHP